jgi:uncharacterized MAPEG superfamily protein
MPSIAALRLRRMARARAVVDSYSNMSLPKSGGTAMSLELALLIWSVGLAFVQMLVAASGAILQFGLPDFAGNRENLQPATSWAGRAQRAHRNMLENLVLFAVLVLVTEITNKNNAMTGFGAQLFFWARVIYAIIYVIGLPWLRTGVWFISMVGLILIFLQLV